ncbi:hypothetical protein GCU56_00075 [Geodermatophilus sabuli]|uniref:Uncharacterized protein n=1 Tax=Geodermatophilus sabuli TaxID=1564158 RepID=A0A7K3VV59_9ACTN|nr:hypothetical protein [Geodermatophilus sabuli]NEK56270.1 hypothetical protein [Geodermatophilus sabuli]
MTARDDDPGGRARSGAEPGTAGEAVPPDPPVGPGVPTRQDTDVPDPETPTAGTPDDPHDPPVGG